MIVMPTPSPVALATMIWFKLLWMVPVVVLLLLAVAFWLTVTKLLLTLDTVVPPGKPNPLTGSPLLKDAD